jgi:hypothetical protein
MISMPASSKLAAIRFPIHFFHPFVLVGSRHDLELSIQVVKALDLAGSLSSARYRSQETPQITSRSTPPLRHSTTPSPELPNSRTPELLSPELAIFCFAGNVAFVSFSRTP